MPVPLKLAKAGSNVAVIGTVRKRAKQSPRQIEQGGSADSLPAVDFVDILEIS